MESLLSTLLLWIAANSSYDTRGVPHPDVQLMTALEITEEYYSDAPERIPEDGIDSRIKALYAPNDGSKGTIYLLHDGDVEEIYEYAELREILLHELVHHVQWQTGVADTWSCRNHGELEAYKLGALYLHQQLSQDHLISRGAWAQIYSAC
jgi:hypothetical protein